MGIPGSVPQRRAHRRNRILVLVRWHNRREEAASAEICDVSAQGVFLVPSGALPDEINAGDPVWIVVPTPDGDTTLTGIIRWRGFHPSHELIGCGIQLDATSLGTVQRIFPVVSDTDN